MGMENGKKTISITFKEAKNYQKVVATGVWGGANPQGEIICNFFIEQRPYPDSLKMEVDVSTGEFTEVGHYKEESVVREVQTTVVMRADIAKSIGEWLIAHAGQVALVPPSKE